ncbi:HVA22-like protein k, partial [Pyrus ussuriensis x Pyrus communis]
CPMYYHMKFAFLVWLQLPTVDGAKQLYTSHLRPFFLKHQARIDQVLGLTYGEVHKLLSAHQAEIEYARVMIMKILGSDQPPNSDVPRQNAIEGQIRPPNPDLPGQNAIEGQTRPATVSESDHDD